MIFQENSMKILHVAVFTPTSTNVWKADGFEELGHEVIRYDYRSMAKRYGSIRRDTHLISLCRKERPDFSLFSKCNKMHVNVVKECGKIGKTVLWYMDNFHNMDVELIEKMKKCDFVFACCSSALNKAREYNDKVYRHHGGYDSNIHRPVDVLKTRDVVFVGGMYPYRMPYRGAVDFEVLNNVFNEDHARIVSETKINLNFTEGDGVSNRIYKILGAGGFLLTLPWDSMEEDGFEPGKDFDTFTNPIELGDKIKYYLKHEDEREKIAVHGYETVKQYDHINYARKILEVVL